MPSARRDAGFTLIEAMTALGVFALAAMALLSLNTENARALYALETGAYARIVAENQLVVAMVEPSAGERGVQTGVDALAGREWRWTRTVAPTPEPDLMRIEVRVTLEGEDRVAAELVGFRGVR